jgi:hypothetical protein
MISGIVRLDFRRQRAFIDNIDDMCMIDQMICEQGWCNIDDNQVLYLAVYN